MKKSPKQEAWIPMVDYLHRGVRKEKVRVNPLAGKRHQRNLPETWVPMEEAMLRGVEKKRHSPDAAFIQRIKPPPPTREVPPEAYLTIFHGLQQIWAMPKANGAVFSRLRALQAADQADQAAGRITAEEFQRRRETTETIRSGYAAQTEAVTEWFLTHCFRLFETLPNALNNPS
ncbi:MAG: hypothetical protein HQM02_10850 [Magnetococcales bacterium]|nr:hypothetical protein [Magnetococcales bacterium]